MKKMILLFCTFFMLTGVGFAATELTLGTVNWEPYYGKNLENDGVTAAVAKAAFDRVGYKINIQYMEWNRAVALTKSGKLDGLFGCYYSEERTKVMNISDSIGEVEMVLFAKKGSNIKYNSIEDLKPYKIGVMKGQKYTSDFDAADFLKKEPVNKFELNIKKLLSGRIDLIIESRVVLLDVINKQFPQEAGNIEVLDPPLQTNTLHIGFSKKVEGHEKTMEDFNKGLEMIKEDGTLEKIMKKYGF